MNNLQSIHEHVSLKKAEFYTNDKISKPKYLEQIKSLKITNRLETDLTKIHNIKEQIKEIKLKIYKNDKLQKDYYLKNFNILEKYYLNKKNIDQNINEKIDINTILFKSKPLHNNNNIFKVDHYIRYWSNNNVIIDNNDNIQFCINCRSEIDDSICKICSVINKTLETTTLYDLKENIKMNYVRINHMKKVIKQIQGIKTMNIPLKIIETIKNRIDKERIDYNELTNDKIKIIIKQ